MKKTMDDPEGCTCDEGCFGFGECACIYVYDDGEGESGVCRCFCDVPEPDEARSLRRIRKLPSHARIAITTRKITGAKLGRILGAFSKAEIAIPASMVRKRLSFKLKDTTLGKVVSKSGLVVIGRRTARKR